MKCCFFPWRSHSQEIFFISHMTLRIENFCKLSEMQKLNSLKYKVFKIYKKIKICYKLSSPLQHDCFVIFLIHSADPQSRPIVITIFTHVVRPYFSKSSKIKEISSENNVHYWRRLNESCMSMFLRPLCENFFPFLPQVKQKIHF